MEKIIQETVPNDSCPILLLGDFNDFDGHIKTHFLGRNFQYLHQEKTFPNFFPMLRPDKIFTRNLHVHRSHIIKNRQTLLMSDHLPIIMEIEF